MRPGLIDLASARLGGRAVLANDEFFAPKSNLVKPEPAVFLEGKYTSRGKWMDGWETRRRRTPGHDWCIVRLGVPGVIRVVVVDTRHFRGNHPEACALDAANLRGEANVARLRKLGDRWTGLVPRSPLAGDTANEFPVTNESRVTHVRLNIFPDGGVARLRLLGEARPDWERLRSKRARVDLVAAQHGGVALAASDEFFSHPQNLVMPGRPADMGDGWETRRRRGPAGGPGGHDWVVLRLGHRGTIEEVVVDTTHFKGNYPESCRLEACDLPELSPSVVPPPDDGAPWRELVPRTRLRPDTPHRFRAIGRSGPVTHVRLSIIPDGGVARLRLFGKPT